MAAVKTATQAELDKLREAIRQTQAELESLDSRLLPKSDALAKFTVWADEAAARFEDTLWGRINPWFTHGAAPSEASLGLVPLRGETEESPPTADLTGLLAWLFRDQLRAKITEAVEELDLTDTLSAEDRPRLRRDLEERLVGLERREESLIRVSEVAGMPLERRADARPEIVLAVQI